MERPAIEIREGSVVTFGFHSFSSQGVPSDPVIVRVREDVSWEDVVRYFWQDKRSGIIDTVKIFTIIYCHFYSIQRSHQK